MSAAPQSGAINQVAPRLRYKTCSACRKRDGHIRWGDALALTHGFHEMRCERCAYAEQLRHALGRLVAIPRLATKLAWAVITQR